MYRQSEKKLSNSNISSTCPYNAANFGPLTAEISLPVWGTPANFDRFRILLSLLQRHRSPEANQTLDMFGRLLGWYIMYTFSGPFAPMEFCQVQKFTLYPSLAFSYMTYNVFSGTLNPTHLYHLVYWQHYCRALHLQASSKLCGVVQGMELQNFCRGRHLYLAGWTSRWASAHILVDSGFS